MDKEIIEGNKLIAEFMGGKIMPYGNSKPYPKGLPNWALNEYDFDILKVGGFDYHSSWDWLMPVVEKIEKIFQWEPDKGKYISVDYFSINYSRRYPDYTTITCISICTKLNGAMSEFHDVKTASLSKIESVWLAVVEFIKWYNQNK